VENPETRRPLGIPRHIWDDNIKMDPTETEWEGVEKRPVTASSEQHGNESSVPTK
jgi:hypothetical protein